MLVLSELLLSKKVSVFCSFFLIGVLSCRALPHDLGTLVYLLVSEFSWRHGEWAVFVIMRWKWFFSVLGIGSLPVQARSLLQVIVVYNCLHVVIQVKSTAISFTSE